MKERSSVKIIIAIIITILILVSIGITAYLITQRQQVQEKAAVPEGEAKVSLSPVSGTYKINEPFTATIFLNTDNIPIEGVAIRLTYPYSGTEPELVASNIQISTVLLTTGEWSCPVKTVTAENGIVKIDLGCFNTSIGGFSTATDTELATVDLVANRVPATNPIVLRFDQNESIITRKADAQDTLLIPSGTGSFTINDGANNGSNPTATPNPGGQQPTATPTSTVGGTNPTPTPNTPTVTPTPIPPTKAPQVPVTNYSLPTFLISGAGILLFVLGVSLF